MNRLGILAAGLAMAISLPAIAEAASGFATANVNLRAGPSTGYPAVTVIPAGAGVNINGCMSGANWCDVEFRGIRGWVSGSYVQVGYQQRRVYVAPEYYRPLGIPTVTFSVGNYWDRHYRGRDFYRERDMWDDRGVRRPPPARWDGGNRLPPPRWEDDNRRRPDWREERRDDRRDVRRDDRRDDRRDVRRDDRRDDRRDARRDNRPENRRDIRLREGERRENGTIVRPCAPMDNSCRQR